MVLPTVLSRQNRVRFPDALPILIAHVVNIKKPLRLVFNINNYMKRIEDYIKLSKEDRQSHLNLNESCVFRSTIKNGTSGLCKALLAHVLDTEIPFGMKIHLCHACNQGHCCNPNHLYWGTAKENFADTPRKSAWERTVEKYGLAEAKLMQGRGNKAAGGKAGKGKVLSETHKNKISKSLLQR